MEFYNVVFLYCVWYNEEFVSIYIVCIYIFFYNNVKFIVNFCNIEFR